jgi:hypothetical protein
MNSVTVPTSLVFAVLMIPVLAYVLAYVLGMRWLWFLHLETLEHRATRLAARENTEPSSARCEHGKTRAHFVLDEDEAYRAATDGLPDDEWCAGPATSKAHR